MAQDLDTALRGISGILVTPYDTAGEIAPEKLAPIIDRAVAAGVHMPVVNGNTGEFYALTTDEACTMVHEVAAMLDDRAPLLGGVGRGIRDACRLAEASARAGAAALRGGRARLHLGADQRVAGTLGRDPRGARSRGLRSRRPTDRHDAPVRGHPCRGTERHNVTGVKAALQAIGLDCGPTRPPSAWPLTNAQTATMNDLI